jgi:hypothetical protein
LASQLKELKSSAEPAGQYNTIQVGGLKPLPALACKPSGSYCKLDKLILHLLQWRRGTYTGHTAMFKNLERDENDKGRQIRSYKKAVCEVLFLSPLALSFAAYDEL